MNASPIEVDSNSDSEGTFISHVFVCFLLNTTRKKIPLILAYRVLSKDLDIVSYNCNTVLDD